MIRVFPPSATDFTSGGIALQPSECIVTEEANGAFDVTLTMPRDDTYNRHEYLVPENILFLTASSKNVPIRHTVRTEGTVRIYKAKGKATTKKSGYWYIDELGRHEQWVDRFITTYSSVPMYVSDTLTNEAGKVAHGKELTYISETDSAIFCASLGGLVGYIKKTECYFVREEQGDVITVVDDGTYANKMQPFRIVSAEKKSPGTYTARAEHLTFDCNYETLQALDLTNKPLSELCDALTTDRVKYITGVEKYITRSWKAPTSVTVVSDIAEDNDLQLIRDGCNVYILPADTSNVTLELKTGETGNITRLETKTDTSGLITRVIPVINDSDGNPADQEAIDSEHIDEHPFPYIERVTVETEEEGQAEAAKLYAAGSDLPKITVTVACLAGALDGVSVFDTAHVVDDLTGVDVTGRINTVKTDACTGHVTEIEIGSAKDRVTVSVFAAVSGTWQISS